MEGTSTMIFFFLSPRVPDHVRDCVATSGSPFETAKNVNYPTVQYPFRARMYAACGRVCAPVFEHEIGRPACFLSRM